MKSREEQFEIDRDCLIDLFRKMLLIRLFEEKIVEMYPLQDMKSPVHLYIGQEAIAAGVCANLTNEDYVFTTHRSHGHCLAKGSKPEALYAEFYGRVSGCCRGKGGSMHPVDPENGILGTTAIVGGNIPLATGTALASKMRRDGRVSVAFFGDGASEEGTFHESLNFASLKQLPVVFVCENNFYATNSHVSARQPHDSIAKRAAGYEMPGLQANGNEVLEIYTKAREAIHRAREGKGPTLLECRTYRWKGHVGPDCDYEKGCRPKSELEDWMKECPIELFKNYLMGSNTITEEQYRAMASDLNEELDSAIRAAREASLPRAEELLMNVYYGDK
jgi:pyruvate dehydrogenase E1 component alpha subunit